MRPRQSVTYRFFGILLLISSAMLGGCGLFVSDEEITKDVRGMLEKQSQEQWSKNLVIHDVVLIEESLGRWKGHVVFALKNEKTTERAKLTVTMNWKGQIYYECEPPRQLLALEALPGLLMLRLLGL